MEQVVLFVSENWLKLSCGLAVDIIAVIIWYQSGLSPVAVFKLVAGVVVRLARALFKSVHGA